LADYQGMEFALYTLVYAPSSLFIVTSAIMVKLTSYVDKNVGPSMKQKMSLFKAKETFNSQRIMTFTLWIVGIASVCQLRQDPWNIVCLPKRQTLANHFIL
jgi:hypothetical protein